jgi:glycosyltransferase involved in cell wall biosynthesis
MPAIHQLVAGFNRGDAISNDAVVLRGIFREWGFESEIFAEPQTIHPALKREGFSAPALRERLTERDFVVLHLSIGSDVNDLFTGLPGRKVIRYHNITPATYFETLQPRTAALLRRGRAQMRRLAGVAELNLAVSRYNADELKAAGYDNVLVHPIVVDFADFEQPSNRKIEETYGGGGANVLFVGRCAPNKSLEDLVRVFGCFQKHVQPASRLIHVGSYQGMEAYHGMVRILARNLGLQDVHFMGSVTQRDFVSFYRVADLFLCLSEHEGFCLPLLESMHFDVPVLAYDAAAVSETLDGSGILVSEKNAEPIAEMMGEMLRNRDLREAVIRGQRDRLDRYRSRDLPKELREHLSPMLEG